MCEIFFKSCVNNDHASLKEFDKVFGDGGYIDNFNKKCLKEIEDEIKGITIPEANESQNLQNRGIKRKKNTKLENVSKASFNNLAKFKESVRQIKVAESNQQLIDQCEQKFQREEQQTEKQRQPKEHFLEIYQSQNSDNNEEQNDATNIDDILNNLADFYREFQEQKELTKLQIHNLSESIKFESMKKYSQT
ncbi:hypothetical protein M9Y10_028804 [Tritrichomonas musculus]|uniref:Uncharacterized protein n=1 Tax=Tritrichomonas musculus TaxID=1915356 RepID=A0ABR2KLG9_9EUKA